MPEAVWPKAGEAPGPDHPACGIALIRAGHLPGANRNELDFTQIVPFYFRIPLPVPFGYSARVGGRRRRHAKQATQHHSVLPGLPGRRSTLRAPSPDPARRRAEHPAQRPRRRRGTTWPLPKHRQQAPFRRNIPYIRSPPRMSTAALAAARVSEDAATITLDLLTDSGEPWTARKASVAEDRQRGTRRPTWRPVLPGTATRRRASGCRGPA